MKPFIIGSLFAFTFMMIATPFSLADSENMVDLLKKVTSVNRQNQKPSMSADVDLFSDTVPHENQNSISKNKDSISKREQDETP